jgi:hypothetical protein
MDSIVVDVWLYGDLSRYGGREDSTGHAHLPVRLPAGSRLEDLLAHLGLPTEKRGLTFINGTLTATPKKQPDLQRLLEHDDRIALFHLKSMWPFQYRDGAQLSSELNRSLQGDDHSHTL